MATIGVSTEAGLITHCDSIAVPLGGGEYRLRLLKSSFTPGPAVVWSDLEECDFTGYSPVLISAFDAAAIVGDVAVANTISPLLYGPYGVSTGNIYGWAITGDADDIVYATAVFDGGPLVVSAGITLAITLTLTLGQP